MTRFGVLRVHVADASMKQCHGDCFALVVEDRDLPRIGLRMPERVVAVLERRRRGLDLVLPPGDAGRVDHVRHRVPGMDVVERALERVPDVLQVREIRVVDRLDQLAGDGAREVLDGREPHVEARLAGGQLRERLLLVLERRDVDRDLVLLLELLDDGRVDVGRPVEDVQRALFGVLARRDRIVVGVEGQRHRMVSARERNAAGADRHADGRAERIGRAEQRVGAREGDGGSRRCEEELPPGRSTLARVHRDLLRSIAQCKLR